MAQLPNASRINCGILNVATRWFTVQLLPQLVETAAANLSRQGFIPFFPRIELRRRRKIPVIEPMFRGYGFVQIDLAVDRWLSVNGTRGVVGLLPRYSLYPHPMPDGLVEFFRSKDPFPEENFLGALTDYCPGITTVEVLNSHRLLAGRRGLVVAVRERLLQVSFFTQDTKISNPVWLDRDHVQSVD